MSHGLWVLWQKLLIVSQDRHRTLRFLECHGAGDEEVQRPCLQSLRPVSISQALVQERQLVILFLVNSLELKTFNGSVSPDDFLILSFILSNCII